MLKNEDVTVINEYGGAYRAFTLHGCSLVGKTAKAATEQGLVSADFLTLRIPAPSASFLPPKEFTELFWVQSENGKPMLTESGEKIETNESNAWTLEAQKTFIVIGGAVSTALTDVKTIFNTHKVYRVCSVSDNRHGPPRLWHWRCDLK